MVSKNFDILTPHVAMIFFRDDLYIQDRTRDPFGDPVLFYLVFWQTGIAHMYNKGIIAGNTYIEMHISVRIPGFTDCLRMLSSIFPTMVHRS